MVVVQIIYGEGLDEFPHASVGLKSWKSGFGISSNTWHARESGSVGIRHSHRGHKHAKSTITGACCLLCLRVAPLQRGFHSIKDRKASNIMDGVRTTLYLQIILSDDRRGNFSLPKMEMKEQRYGFSRNAPFQTRTNASNLAGSWGSRRSRSSVGLKTKRLKQGLKMGVQIIMLFRLRMKEFIMKTWHLERH